MSQSEYLTNIFNKNKDAVLDQLSKTECFGLSELDCKITTIIPFTSRMNHLRCLIESYIKSKEECEFEKGEIVVVEHSEHPEAKDLCLINKIPYMFIPRENKLFNKCLCMNAGSFMSKGKFLMFHDVDIPIPSKFWSNLDKNMSNYFLPTQYIQSFTKKRINYISEHASNGILNNKIDLYTVCRNKSLYKKGSVGAPGGSILVRRDTFEKVGGYDPYYFTEYSAEDAFFLDKLSSYSEFRGCDNPPIEMFHIFHEQAWKKCNKDNLKISATIFKTFSNLKLDEKKLLMKLFRKSLYEQQLVVKNNK